MSDQDQAPRQAEMIGLVADIVSAYVSNNPVPRSDLAELIGSVYDSMSALNSPAAAPEAEAPKPAVPVKGSVKKNHIVCLECGKKFKSIRRHLDTAHGTTPDEYRARWQLPASYPMVAPDYASARSEMAKKMGFGRKPASAKTRARKKS